MNIKRKISGCLLLVCFLLAGMIYAEKNYSIGRSTLPAGITECDVAQQWFKLGTHYSATFQDFLDESYRVVDVMSTGSLLRNPPYSIAIFDRTKNDASLISFTISSDGELHSIQRVDIGPEAWVANRKIHCE